VHEFNGAYDFRRHVRTWTVSRGALRIDTCRTIQAWWYRERTLKDGSTTALQDFSMTGLPPPDIALSGATIYVSPFEPPIYDGVVLLEGGRIGAVGPGYSLSVPTAVRTIDCTGSTITSGFWNSHVHFFERKWAEARSIPAAELSRQLAQFARYGFTSVFDLSSSWENTRTIRDRIGSGELPGPSIRSTGEGLVPPGGLPPESTLRLLGVMPTPLPEIADATSATAAARDLLSKGVDGIKVFASGAPPTKPKLAQSAMQAAVHEAHLFGKPVFVHPNSADEILDALHAGVDVIAHTTPGSGPWSEALLDAIEERDVALTPTLRLWKHAMQHDRISVRDRLVEVAVQQLRSWIEAHATVLFGTDVGAIDVDPTQEYTLMAQAGMNFAQILASLTTSPAKRFGAAGAVGRVAEGYQADLVVCKGDPVDDIRALSNVRYTLRAGNIVYQSS
jgi:imidazolonepropionase-like amidohydrolase